MPAGAHGAFPPRCPQLREQRAAVEELVEGVVEAYHSGFNKAAHNYSQILRLFAESKQQARLSSTAGRDRCCTSRAAAPRPARAAADKARPPPPPQLRSWRRCAARWARRRAGCRRGRATWRRSTSGTRC